MFVKLATVFYNWVCFAENSTFSARFFARKETALASNGPRLDLDTLFCPPATITLVSGPQGSGKTVLCLRALDAARAAGLRVGGVLSPGRYDSSGQRIGIDLLDPISGERWPLAERIHPAPAAGRKWRFDPATLARGADLLAAVGDCDLLLVDEIGPIELLEGGGWRSALDVLRAGSYQRALVVVRPNLLDVLVERLTPLLLHTLTLP